MAETTTTIYIGNIIHCNKPFTVHTFEKGFIAVRGSKILAIDNVSALGHHKTQLALHNTHEVILTDSQILIPGLIDTHIHAPQYPNIGVGLDKPLLEWLEAYTFPLEKKYKDAEFSRKVYNAVVKRTLYHGTTTACYFATIFGDTSLLLVNAAIKYGQRAFVGKVNMTRFAPCDYMESSEDTISNTRRFIESVLARQSDLVKPIIMPRFALSVSTDDMKKLGDLAKEYNLPIQTHISENLNEIREVEKVFSKSYAEVYDDADLLTEKTTLAHAIYLSKSEIELIAERGTSISHCPSSNICLKSGLCDVKALVHADINVGLGTDVSGGRSVSIIDAMRSAVDTSIAISFNKTDYDPLNCYDAFYLATLGGAQALSIDDVTGNFEVGKDFDALIVDMHVEGCTDFLHECTPLELLQKFVFVGDDRNVVSVFVSGKQVK